ncbi:sphingosine 1-phosphate receptor 4 [Alligator sinensis]|uniref:Sphingosine 1-phosphate receptor 4 n=1 Tax=Alligator sinensis TaxID=38654 RepID=A0A1U7RGB9_ALLSI|nr:sphingosine 1-phosphate receptor 4 [Alligator sinensis]XP_025052245.1 sphingosine 1-phosphate receptor 4 [Alligator sinensis]XP_025052246.1 sphingosine 1-phosphate receptor 4 [Alligator sinensis]XP_025052247.1 sphingosine 1-phosphate receptor 4 [Alligator sinensis]XP_025052248.1 sphingosine 1-phosphate receptor 4 [Alligator sinensis]XP_025052249.1 sphingosine 1-phosphate receptor 4 [Alligator sinensis]XP_025052250.1 sphingosine 1-phosphate receptor 4 [Alligator sinensis]
MEIPAANFFLASSMDSCLQLVAQKNINIILQHYNYTGRLSHRRSQGDGMSLVSILVIVVSCLIVMENLLVLLAMWSMRTRRWVYSCIASITVSDLLAGVAYVFNLCLSGRKTFQLSPQLWFLREGILFIALAASIFSLLVTAIERYSTMVRPIAESESTKAMRLRGFIVSFWLLAILIGLLPLLGWNCLCDFDSCSTLLPLYSKKYVIICVFVFSIILIGIVGLYVAIYRLVRAASITRHSNVRSLRLLKTVLIILGAFIFCWSPLFALLLIDAFCKPQACKHPYPLDFALAMAVLNSAINPIIYSFRSADVRQAIVGLLCCCCIRLGLRGPGDCLVVPNIHSGSSTESSLRCRDSFRSPVISSPRPRAPLSSNSSMLSNPSSI